MLWPVACPRGSTGRDAAQVHRERGRRRRGRGRERERERESTDKGFYSVHRRHEEE